MRTRNLWAAATLSVLLMAACTDLESPLAGRIWSPPQDRWLGEAELTAKMLAADAVLIGETHDNPTHHHREADLVFRLAQNQRHPLVVFEMIDAARQPQLDQWLRDHPGDAAGLGEVLDWRHSGWPDWPLYQPIITAALTAGAPLAGAGVTRDEARRIISDPTPDAGGPPTSSELDDIQESHCGLLPAAMAPGMVRVQRARDRAMAEKIALGLKAQGSAVLIAGSGHVRTDRGVPLYLPPGTKALSIGLREVDPSRPDPRQYQDEPFDVIIFTERTERPDPCESLRPRTRS